LEVLFFDEYIDQHINNRQAPFLNDTSQAHNKGNRYILHCIALPLWMLRDAGSRLRTECDLMHRFVVLTPNKEGLPKGGVPKYLTFPSRLDHVPHPHRLRVASHRTPSVDLHTYDLVVLFFVVVGRRFATS
jgi:hypothetical protein